MAGLFEADILESDLQLHEQGDALIRVVDVDTPFTRMLRKGKTQTSKLAVWGAYFPEETGDIARAEGADKTDGWGSNKAVPLRSMVQFNRSRGWMLSDIAKLTGTSYAKSEAQRISQQKMADGEGFLLMREKLLLSAQNAADAGDAADNKHRTTGAFAWVNPTQPAGVFAVPEKCRTTAAQWLTEMPTLAQFRAAMRAAGTRMAKAGKWTGIVGPNLASEMNDWVLNDQNVVQSQKDQMVEKLKAVVTSYQFTEGTVDFMTHYRLVCDQNGAPTSRSLFSGLFIMPELWRLAAMEPIQDKDGLDQGGGPRGWWQDACVLQCLNPMGQFAVYAEA